MISRHFNLKHLKYVIKEIKCLSEENIDELTLNGRLNSLDFGKKISKTIKKTVYADSYVTCTSCKCIVGHYFLRRRELPVFCPWCESRYLRRHGSRLICQECIRTCIICGKYFCPECGDQCASCNSPMCIICSSKCSHGLCISCYGEEDYRLRDSYGLTTIHETIKLKERNWKEHIHKDITISGKIIKAPYQFDLSIDRIERPKFILQEGTREYKVCVSNFSRVWVLDSFDIGEFMFITNPLRPSKNEEARGIDFLIDDKVTTINKKRPCDRYRENLLLFRQRKETERRERKKLKKKEKKEEKTFPRDLVRVLRPNNEKNPYYEGDDWDKRDHKNSHEYGDEE